MPHWINYFGGPQEIMHKIRFAEATVMPLILRLNEEYGSHAKGHSDGVSAGVLLTLVRRLALRGMDMEELARIIQCMAADDDAQKPPDAATYSAPLRVIEGGKRRR